MPVQLHTAKGRKGEAYKIARANALGSWNADLPQGALPFGHFSDLKNYRKIRPTEIEVRTGYKEWIGTSGAVPVATAEYRLDTAFRDITLYALGGNLIAFILNQIDGTFIIKTIVTGGITADTKVAAQQYNTFLFITVRAIGNYLLSPAAEDLSSWNNVFSAGKDLATCPASVDFPLTTTGDLIVYDAHGKAGQGDVMDFNYPLNSEEPVKIRCDIKTNYFRADKTEIAALKLFNLWTLGIHDNEIASIGTRTPEETDHLWTRCFGFKFVFVHEITDVKGQKFTYRSAPSVDMWVEDRLYCVPFYYDLPNSPYPARFPRAYNKQSAPDRWDMTTDVTFLEEAYFTNAITVQQVPSTADLLALSEQFRDFLHSGVATDPYFFAALWLHHTQQAGYDFGSRAPYKIAVPCSELKKASLATFQWSDFTLPSDVIAVEIYRTAASQPNDDDNATLSPEFQPYRYGFIGQLTKDTSSFVDTNATPDYGQSPDRYLGLLTDQFSGSVVTVYNEDHLVLGDTESIYYVNAPTPTNVQAFATEGIFFTFNKSDLKEISAGGTDPGDGIPQNSIYLQYQDKDGNTSDLTRIIVDCTNPHSGDNVFVAITLPRGYSADITAINIWFSDYVGGPNPRNYYLIDSVPVAKGWIQAFKNTLVTPVSIRPIKKIVTSDDPGSIRWNAPQDMFSWPGENFLIIHQTATVTGFGITIGMLTVFCDRATWATDLGIRTEVKSNDVGLISRWAVTEIQKIPFFLSQSGLYVSEPSGVKKFPIDVESEVLKYINEEIPSVENLANARRASMGFLSKRDELWLYFPSSKDLGGLLDSRLFIFKIPDMRVALSYEFDLANPAPQKRVIFGAHADHKLFASFVTEDGFSVIDTDVDTDWHGPAYWEMKMGMEEPDWRKLLRSVRMTAEIHATMFSVCGLPRKDGGYDAVYGTINTNASVKNKTIRGAGFEQQIYFNVSDSVFDNHGYVPTIRILTQTNDSGEHRARFSSVEALYSTKHRHPQ